MNGPRLRWLLQVLPHKPTGAAFAKFFIQLCAMEIQASELIGTWRDQRKRLMLLEQPAHNRIRLLSNAETHQRLCPKSRIHPPAPAPYAALLKSGIFGIFFRRARAKS